MSGQELSQGAYSLYDLPPELLSNVISHMTPSDLVCFSRVSKEAYQCLQVDKTWLPRGMSTLHDWLQPTCNYSWTKLALMIKKKQASFLHGVEVLSLVSCPPSTLGRLFPRREKYLWRQTTKVQITSAAILDSIKRRSIAASQVHTPEMYHYTASMILKRSYLANLEKLIVRASKHILECSLAAGSSIRFLKNFVKAKHWCIDWGDLEEVQPVNDDNNWANLYSSDMGNMFITLSSGRECTIHYHGLVVPPHHYRLSQTASIQFINYSQLKSYTEKSLTVVKKPGIEEKMASTTFSIACGYSFSYPPDEGFKDDDEDVMHQKSLQRCAEALSLFGKDYLAVQTVALSNAPIEDITKMDAILQDTFATEGKGRKLKLISADDVGSCTVCGHK
jgi:hypothetical protein